MLWIDVRRCGVTLQTRWSTTTSSDGPLFSTSSSLPTSSHHCLCSCRRSGYVDAPRRAFLSTRRVYTFSKALPHVLVNRVVAERCVSAASGRATESAARAGVGRRDRRCRAPRRVADGAVTDPAAFSTSGDGNGAAEGPRGSGLDA